MDTKGRFTTVVDIKEFCLAGNARITIVGTATRFTYKISVCKDNDKLWFVAVLTGSDNEQDYTYLGTIRAYLGTVRECPGINYEYYHGVKSRIDNFARGAIAFRWFFRQIWHLGKLEESLQVWHEGHCGRCGRLLTVPDSIARGIGPECMKIMGEV